MLAIRVTKALDDRATLGAHCGHERIPSVKKQHEEFSISGSEVVEKVKSLVHEGNIRRIFIKNERGETLVEIPVTFAAVGALFAPVLAALGAMAALLTKCTIVVERKKT